MEEELTKRDFEKELKAIVVSCIGVKEDTAKKKASAIFRKYEELISWSKSDGEYYRTQYFRERDISNALRTGRVHYKTGDIKGVLLIKDIEQVEVREKDVLLTTKAGREISLGKDFEYLRDVF